MTTAKHTPGPWAWFGNASSNSLYLATTHSGRRFVMDFTRWGFRGAQPRFQTERGIMIDAKDLLQFEVGNQSVVGVDEAKKDTSVYRLDVRGINSADARLIAAAPDLLEALKSARTIIQEDRDDMFEAVTVAGIESTMDEIDRPGIERLDAVLSTIDAALSKAEGRG